MKNHTFVIIQLKRIEASLLNQLVLEKTILKDRLLKICFESFSEEFNYITFSKMAEEVLKKLKKSKLIKVEKSYIHFINPELVTYEFTTKNMLTRLLQKLIQ